MSASSSRKTVPPSARRIEAVAVAFRASERPFDVAEEFAFDQVGVERGDARTSSGFRASRAVGVNGPRDQLPFRCHFLR